MMGNVGRHCSKCSALDFLPLQCQSCKDSFCQICIDCDVHACPERHVQSKSVPICPLCGQAVPVRLGEPPDARVERHIADGCTKPKNTTQSIYIHSCNLVGCSRKEAVPCKCKACAMNFCLRHRQPDTHGCTGLLQPTAANTTARQAPRKRPRTTSPAKVLSSTAGTRSGVSATATSDPRQNTQPSVADAFSAHLRRRQKQDQTASVSKSGPGAAAQAAERSSSAAASAVWSCSVCTLRNSGEAQQCVVCGEDRPAGAAKASAKATNTAMPAVIDLCDEDSDYTV